MKDAAIKCIEDIKGKIKTVPSVAKNIHHIYSEDDIVTLTKGLSYPCVGVLYDGIRSSPEQGATSKQGLSAEIVCSVMLFFRAASNVASKDSTSEALQLLDSIRDSIKGQRSPTGHFWRFQMEAALGGKNSVLIYIQRWAAPVQLT